MFKNYVSGGDFVNAPLTFEGMSVHVVKASKGYPEAPIVGERVVFNKGVDPLYFFAGVVSRDGALYTSGGRVCGLTTVEKTFQAAINSCYENLEQVSFKDQHYRKDIGSKAISKECNEF
jgi:phosphoribosylamine---glycine ligase